MAKKMFVTHKGTAVYPWINKPDNGFGDGQPKYKCGLRVPKDQMKHIEDACRELAKENLGNKADKARMPWKQSDEDAEAGLVIVNAKSQYQPKVYDAAGNYIPANKLPQIWGGSVLKMGGTINTYDRTGNTGVSLLLTKIQIIELVEGGSGEDGGFEAEDGWIAPEGANDDQEAEEQEEGFKANF